MEKEFISRSNRNRLILLFSGWGMDANPFRNLQKPGYDILAIFNYTDFDAEADFPAVAATAGNYSEIVVAGWSFGVRIASEFLARYRRLLPITKAIAVNGTEQHIDDRYGIPQKIFNGTLENLSETTLRKFRRRMFSSANDFAVFMENAPQRSFANLRAELETFGKLPPLPHSGLWNHAVAGSADAIFPPAAQCESWHGVTTDVIEGMPHFPDFAMLLNRYLIDKDLVAERFSGARGTYRANAVVQHAVAKKLWNLTTGFLPQFPATPRILEIGVGNGMLTELYATSFAGASLTLWDIADIDTSTLPPRADVKQCDAETEITVSPDESYDLIISSSTVQWFNSPAGFIEHAAHALAPGGLLALSLYGPETYRELTRITGNSLNYPTLSSLKEAACKANLKILTSQEETAGVTFSSMKDMLRHIKLTGVNAVSNRSGDSSCDGAGTSRAVALLRRFPTAPDGTATLTYHPLYIIMQKQ